MFIPARQLMKKVLDLIPEDLSVFFNEKQFKQLPWCWISLAEFINAKLLESTIPEAASQSSQNRARESAIQHFATSAEYAVNAEHPSDRCSLVMQATEGTHILLTFLICFKPFGMHRYPS
jgi:uncharacterized membrane protein